ncbi:MAG: CHASE2 domain-containing protein [Pyrinomonadaceae bacterium]
MSLVDKYSFVPYLLRRWYWALAIMLTCVIWGGLALVMRPLRDADGSYASHPYGLMTGLENQALDLFFQLRDARHQDLRTRGLREPITIVEIDEASIKASNVRLQKWPRDWYARLVDRASEGGASVIGLDTFLSEQGGVSTEDKAADQKLVKSIASAGNVVLPMKTAAGGFDEIKPLPMFADPAYAVGFVDLPLDKDGFVRSSQLSQTRPGQDTRVSFATRLAEGYLAAGATEGAPLQYLKLGSDGRVRLGERVISLRTDLNLQLDYRARSPAFRRISAGDILFNQQAQIPDDLFRDRIVLIGASNIDAPDLFPTCFYEPMALARLFDRSLTTVPKRTPGVELHATAAMTMLVGNMLTRPRYLGQIGAVLLALSLVALAVFRLRALWGLLAVVLIAALALVVSSWTFDAHGLILPLASAWLGMIVLTPLGLGLRYGRERVLRSETEAERAQVMDIFSRFVSSEVAVQMWEQRGHLSLAGERHVVTVIFTDIRNFTTLSESVSSGTVVEWLNDYFSRMHAVVKSFGGHINKFLGDGLMIVFGAPVDRGDQQEARAAVDCGLAMLAAVEHMNGEWANTGRPVIKIGVGIHTGEATCGVVGAERRLEYTLIGDTVNLASRLESTTKEFGVPILVSEATAQLLGNEYELRALGEVKVKGKTKSTAVLTVTGKKPEVESIGSVAEAK